MENRKKVVLHKRDGGCSDVLALTDDQIKLLYWLINEDILHNDEWDIQVRNDTEVWVEV